MRLDDGRQMTAIELQRVYLDRAGTFWRPMTMSRFSTTSSVSGYRYWTDWNETPWSWSGKSIG